MSVTSTRAARISVLIDLISFSRPLNELEMVVSSFEFDTSVPLVTMTKDDLKSILLRYLHDELSTEQVADWADLVDARDDVGFPIEVEELMIGTIQRLANPAIFGALTPFVAQEIIQTLN